MHLSTGALKVALTQPWKPRLDRLDEPVEMAFRVWPTDLDVNVHMNNAKYSVAMEVVRWALLIRSGLMGPAVRERWSIVNAAQNIIFFRPLRPFSRFTVDARAIHGDDDWVYLSQHVRQRGRLAATGLFRMRFKRGDERLSARDLARIAGYDPPEWTEPEVVTAWNRVSDELLEAKRREER